MWFFILIHTLFYTTLTCFCICLSVNVNKLRGKGYYLVSLLVVYIYFCVRWLFSINCKYLTRLSFDVFLERKVRKCTVFTSICYKTRNFVCLNFCNFSMCHTRQYCSLSSLIFSYTFFVYKLLVYCKFFVLGTHFLPYSSHSFYM